MTRPPVRPGRPGADLPLLSRRILDRQLAELRRQDRTSWGPWPWLGPLLSLIVLLVAGLIAGTLLSDAGSPRTLTTGLLSIALDVLLCLALLGFGRPLAALGGWRAAVGLRAPTRADLAPFGLGLLGVFFGRWAVAVVANLIAPGASSQAQNLGLGHLHALDAVVVGVALVGCAPVAEELMFRGLLLRVFMRRLTYWPAALLSTGLFALFHVYEADTVAGAVTLAAVIAVLGLVNCTLVRITGRLTPGIAVHAAFNLLALVVLLARG